MLKIRLSRKGRKKKPFFNIIVTDSKSSRDGKFIEKIGFYSPINKICFYKKDRLKYWNNIGAKKTLVVKKITKN